jgi:hypothetical protein
MVIDSKGPCTDRSKIVTVAKMAYAPAERLLPRHADILEHKIIPFRDFREVSPLATALGPKTEKRRQLRSQPAPPKTGNRVRVEGGD